MKKLGKFSVSFSAIMLMTNQIVYATTEVEEEGIPSKYIFIGIAALVLVLLLFLGYRMDTKGDEITVPKASKKSNKKYNDLMASSNDVYEEDNINYEMDNNVNTKDLMDSTEYEDDEDSLFTTMSNDSNSNLYTAPNYEDDEEELENMGEEFDTSIIDDIDDEVYEDDEEYVDNIKPTTNSFDETMVFNNPISNLSGSNLEDEIDNLDNMDDFEDNEIEEDPFIEELNNFKEPESTFGEFSVANNELNDFEEVKPKASKKYTKVKKAEVFDDMSINNVSADEDFLAQMEKNLQKNKEERDAKKVTKKATTRKTKE